MDLFTLIVIGLLSVCVTAIILKLLDVQKKKVGMQAQVQQQIERKKGETSHFQDQLAMLPQAKSYLVDMYNAQFTELEKQFKATGHPTKEEAEKILKPLADKIKLIELATEHPIGAPLARVGAALGDKGVNIVMKYMNNFGVE